MRAHVWRCIATKSGTRRELPDGELSADRVRELLKLDVLEKKYPHVAEEIRGFLPSS
jgi:hypothetical protein